MSNVDDEFDRLFGNDDDDEEEVINRANNDSINIDTDADAAMFGLDSDSDSEADMKVSGATIADLSTAKSISRGPTKSSSMRSDSGDVEEGNDSTDGSYFRVNDGSNTNDHASSSSSSSTMGYTKIDVPVSQTDTYKKSTDEKMKSDFEGGDKITPLRSRLPTANEDDFHAIDEGTRDFLDWLDKPKEGSSSINDGDKVTDTSLDLALGINFDSTSSKPDADNGFNDEDDFDFGERYLKDTSNDKEKNDKLDNIKDISVSSLDKDLFDGDTNLDSLNIVDPNTIPALKTVDLEDVDNGSEEKVDTSNSTKESALENDCKVQNENQNDDTKTTPQNVQINESIPCSNVDTKSKDKSSSLQKESNTMSPTSISENDGNESDSSETSSSHTENSLQIEKPIEKEVTFGSLEEALQSKNANMTHIRSLLCSKESGTESTDTSNFTYFTLENPELRKHLFARAICNKTLEDLQSSSLADSFLNWDAQFDYQSFAGNVRNTTIYHNISKGKSMEDIDKIKSNREHEYLKVRVLLEAEELAPRIVSIRAHENALSDFNLDYKGADNNTEDFKDRNRLECATRDICSLLIFHYWKGKLGEYNGNVQKHSLSVCHTEAGDQEQTTEDKCRDEIGEEDKENRININTTSHDSKTNIEDTQMHVKPPDTMNDEEKDSTLEWNRLLAPIAATLLSASFPAPSASVALSAIMVKQMPLVSLRDDERMFATQSLHSRLYLLACYHLPLLVIHLDRCAPGWYWPREFSVNQDTNPDDSSNMEKNDLNTGTKYDTGNVTTKCRNLKSSGMIPLTWFTSWLAGECSCVDIDDHVITEINKVDNNIPETAHDLETSSTLNRLHTLMEPGRVLALWDIFLTQNDAALPFFLLVSLLAKHSDMLLMLRGDELKDELGRILSFCPSNVEEEEFVGNEGGLGDNSGNDGAYIREWCYRALNLFQSTPSSVIGDLRSSEDEAVQNALIVRNKLTMEKMKLRLEAEAELHKKAIEEARDKKQAERARSTNRKRLVTYYTKHAPEKVQSIEKILDTYAGRETLLDQRLKKKYGQGFLPVTFTALASPVGVIAQSKSVTNVSESTNSFFSNIGHGIQSRRKNLVANRASQRVQELEEELKKMDEFRVSVKITCDEILPQLCGGKAFSYNTADPNKTSTSTSDDSHTDTLRYYLVDSRPDEITSQQGRFPTAVQLSPEALMDPERMQQQIEIFESLRGTVHICVMGEGFSSIPKLYKVTHNPTNDKLHSISSKLLEDDESRTNICAHFFIKRGFPFVSILDGGYAAAHAWLARSGPSYSLSITSVLVDYDEFSSPLAELEESYQEQKEYETASAQDKMVKNLQKIMDTSMTRLTITENQLEQFFEKKKKERINPFKNIKNIKTTNNSGKDKGLSNNSFRLKANKETSQGIENDKPDDLEKKGGFNVRLIGFESIANVADQIDMMEEDRIRKANKPRLILGNFGNPAKEKDLESTANESESDISVNASDTITAIDDSSDDVEKPGDKAQKENPFKKAFSSFQTKNRIKSEGPAELESTDTDVDFENKVQTTNESTNNTGVESKVEESNLKVTKTNSFKTVFSSFQKKSKSESDSQIKAEKFESREEKDEIVKPKSKIFVGFKFKGKKDTNVAMLDHLDADSDNANEEVIFETSDSPSEELLSHQTITLQSSVEKTKVFKEEKPPSHAAFNPSVSRQNSATQKSNYRVQNKLEVNKVGKGFSLFKRVNKQSNKYDESKELQKDDQAIELDEFVHEDKALEKKNMSIDTTPIQTDKQPKKDGADISNEAKTKIIFAGFKRNPFTKTNNEDAMLQKEIEASIQIPHESKVSHALKKNRFTTKAFQKSFPKKQENEDNTAEDSQSDLSSIKNPPKKKFGLSFYKKNAEDIQGLKVRSDSSGVRNQDSNQEESIIFGDFED